MSFVHIKEVQLLLENMPDSCKNMEVLIIEVHSNTPGWINYTWPSSFSSSKSLQELSIPRGNINISNISKFIDTSRIRKLAFSNNLIRQQNSFVDYILPKFLFDGSMKFLIVFRCESCSLIGDIPYISNRSNLIELDLRNNKKFGTAFNTSWYEAPTSIRILRLDETNYTSQFYIPRNDLRRFTCISLLRAYNLKKLTTTNVFFVKGELKLPGHAANLDNLLKDHKENISKKHVMYRDKIANDTLRNVLQTTWLVNNMICKNFRDGFDALAVICVENGVPSRLPCGENVMVTTGLLGVN
jgi:hypothetical protein